MKDAGNAEKTEKRLTKRQKSALETQKKLLAAAREIVCERGFANVSVEEITQKSGVAKGTFYTYFKRKEDVICALCGEMFACIRDKAITADGGFLDRLTFYMEHFAAYIEECSLKLCQEWVRTTVEPEFSGNLDGTNKLEFDLESIRKVLVEGVRRGELKPDTPVEALAHTLTNVLYGAMLCWATSNGVYRFSLKVREFCDAFLEPMLRPYLRTPRAKGKTQSTAMQKTQGAEQTKTRLSKKTSKTK